MDQPLKLWIYKTAHLNTWRVYPLLSFDDLVSEGFVVYAKIRRKYPRIRSRAAIMRLMIVSYQNHIHNLANKRRRTISAWAIDDVPGLSSFIEMQPCEYARLMMFVAEAPPRVQAALHALMEPATASCLRGPFPMRPNGTRETANSLLCALLGLPERDVMGEVRQFLTAAKTSSV